MSIPDTGVRRGPIFSCQEFCARTILEHKGDAQPGEQEGQLQLAAQSPV
jgi:hypothetical protein